MTLALPSGPRGRALAVAIAVLGAASVWAGAVAPVLDWYGERAELLRRQSAIAYRMALLVETLPALRREALLGNNAASAGGAGRAQDRAAALLTGATDTIAAAALQQRIDDLAATAGVRVGSREILPGQPDGDLRAIGIRMTVTAPYRSLVGLLLALARSDTPMVADEIQVRGPGGNVRDAQLPVDASMTVTSFRAGKADAQ
jgi:general secretion pathway protein M